MPRLPDYTYEFDWSEQDQEHVATCVEIPGLSGLGPTRAQAVAELEDAIAGWLEHLKRAGLEFPAERKRELLAKR